LPKQTGHSRQGGGNLAPTSKSMAVNSGAGGMLGGGSGAPMTEKQLIISKLKGQNEKLKQELKVLTSKLEEFVEKNR
jgi:hypothetical protein